MSEQSQVEPWLRGVLPYLHPVIGHLIRASQQIREDSAAALQSLTREQLWSRQHGLTSAGFHAKHLAGSTNRLCTYLDGAQLSAEAIASMRVEDSGEDTPEQLQNLIEAAFDRYETLVRALPPEQFGATREVGRKRLQVTAVSLAIHIAEHGQRHTGQLITTAKLVRAFAS